MKAEALSSSAEHLPGVMPSRRIERRETQIARIVDAARTCFLRSGFHGASMQDICAEADMSPGALYRYFPSKEALIEAISAIHRQEDAEILTSNLEHECCVEGLVLATVAHIRHVHESGFAPLFAEIFAEQQRNPALRETCNRSMMQARTMIGEALTHGLARGEINPLVPLDRLLDMMMAVGHGIVTHDLPRGGISIDDIATVVRAMTVSVLRPTGVAVRDSALLPTTQV